MKFNITTSSCYDNVTEILEEYPVLKNYGFQIETDGFGKTRAYVYIDTLEQLVKLCEDVEYALILSREFVDVERSGYEIEIYDSYRE